MLIRECKQCLKSFQPDMRDVKRGNGFFCSLSCAAKYNMTQRYADKKLPNVICAFCKQPFYKSAYKMTLSKSGLYFCSRKHKDAAQRLGGIQAIMPSHYGTSNHKGDYRIFALKNLPNRCNRCGYDKFIEALVVHHRDHNRSNGTIENLEVLCPTCHWEYHLGLAI